MKRTFLALFPAIVKERYRRRDLCKEAARNLKTKIFGIGCGGRQTQQKLAE